MRPELSEYEHLSAGKVREIYGVDDEHLLIVATGLAKAQTAQAGAGCCVLAYQTQCPNCTGHGYDCGGGCTRWAWYCVDPAHHYWLCGECYAGSGCAGCSCGARVIVTNSHDITAHGRVPEGGPKQP